MVEGLERFVNSPPNDQGFDEWYGIPRTTDESMFPSPGAQAAAILVSRTSLLPNRFSTPCVLLPVGLTGRRRQKP